MIAATTVNILNPNPKVEIALFRASAVTQITSLQLQLYRHYNLPN
jgi:hypothetical protein